MEYGPDGHLYVVSLSGETGNSILRFDGESGMFLDTVVGSSQGPLGDARNLQFGADGLLYVSRFASHEIVRFDPSTGTFVDTFVSAEDSHSTNPDGLVFGPDGHLYVVGYGSHNVVRYNAATGEFMDEFVTAGSGGLNDAYRLTFGPDGNLYVGSRGADGIEILQYDGTTGAFLGVFASGYTGLETTPHDIVFKDGSLYAAVSHHDLVFRFDGTSGNLLETYIAGGSDGIVAPPCDQVRTRWQSVGRKLRYARDPSLYRRGRRGD